MKSLYILRHAKSSWDEPELEDFDRPLNKRGKKAAPFMGRLMADRDIVPDIVVSSPAARARSTAELVAEASGFPAQLKFDERIYEASPQMLRQVVSELDEDAGSAMIVGHNPGIEGFVSYLTGSSERMPTAALAHIRLNIDRWADVDSGCGELQAVLRPKDEMKAFEAGG